MEFLNKKYSAKNKDLVKQQKRENNINTNKNYAKRIANLHNDYEQKFVVGRKEYQPQEPVKQIDQIYAEVQNNNNLQNNPGNNNEQGQEVQENLNGDENMEDNGGNQNYEEEHEGEEMDDNQKMQDENMHEEDNEFNGNEENEM